MLTLSRFFLLSVLSVGISTLPKQAYAQSLPASQTLEEQADLASEMVAGIDRFLSRKIETVESERAAFWDRDDLTLEDRRIRLAHLLGVVDERMRPNFRILESVPSSVNKKNTYTIHRLVWDVLSHPSPGLDSVALIHGEGLLLSPDESPVARVIVVPHANNSPEQLCGLTRGLEPEQQLASRLAEAGCQVVVPTIIQRDLRLQRQRVELTDREYLYRSAYELGRQLLGIEVQKVLAAVDWFAQDDIPIWVVGQGDGGMLALYAGALDHRIETTVSVGYFGPRSSQWQEPVDRNVFGRLRYFSDADLARFFETRRLVLGSFDFPVDSASGGRGAPYELVVPSESEIKAVIDQAKKNLESGELVEIHSNKEIISLVSARRRNADTEPQQSITRPPEPIATEAPLIEDSRLQYSSIDNNNRYRRQFQEIDAFNQALLAESQFSRAEFLNQLDTSSLASYQTTIEPYREIFREDVVGAFDERLLDANAKTRLHSENKSWRAYEVQLDVLPDVFAYGLLLLPRDLAPGEKRPVVVCQHGLEGRPTDTITGDHRAYHDFAAELCERGFIVFAPQNPYIFGDRFRVLQRKANSLGRTLFSVIVPQHQQIVGWLQSLAYVDPDRIGFYGLSYGGKSAMRIPALVPEYCLSICSADFNEWVLKNASSREKFSYVWTGEYEIFEWDLGQTFNYFEMAALICPRPFMVERGHHDGVGVDHWVAFEYAKVRHLYAAELGIPERTEIEWFDGPHTINGQATFSFLHRHLHWPSPAE